MGANNLGLGVLLEAKDLASGVLGRFSSNLTGVVGKTTAAGKAIEAGMKQAGLGLGIFAAGALGLAALSGPISAANKFETAIARIATIADEAEFPVSFLRDTVFAMGAEFGGDLETHAAALYSAIGSGAETAAEATAVLASSNRLAIGGLTTVDTAMTGLMGTLNAYGMNLTRAEEVADNFFATVKVGGSDLVVGKLAEGLGRVAPIAATMKVGLHELTGTIARLTAVGIKTDEAMTGLKAVFDRVITPSSKATAEAKRLGIEFDSAALKSKGFEAFILSIIDSPKLAADSMEQLFGSSTEALNAMSALAADRGKFVQFLADVKNSGGASAAAFRTIAGTVEFASSVLKSNLQQMMVKIGDAVAPAFGRILVTINRLVQGFNDIPAPVRTFLVQAFAVSSVLLTIVGGAIAAKGALTVATSALSAMGITAGGAAMSILPIAGTVALVGLALYGLKRAYDENLGGFADRVNAAVADVKLALSALGQLFSDGAFSGAVMDDLAKAENSGIKAFAIEVFLIANRLQAFFGGIGDGFAAAIGVIQPEIDQFVAAVAPIGALLSSLFESEGADAAAGRFDRMASAGQRVGQVLATIAAAVIRVGAWIGQLVSGAVAGISQLGGTFSGLGEALGEVYDAVVEVVDSFGGANESAISMSEIFYAVGIGIAGVFGAIVGIVRGVVSVIAGGFRALASVVGGVVDIIAGIFQGDWERVWLGAKKVVFGLVQAVMATLGGIVEAVAGAADAIASVLGRDLGAAKAVKGFRKQLEADAREFFGVGAPGYQPPPAMQNTMNMASTRFAASQRYENGGVSAPADQLFASVDALAAGQREQATAAAVAAGAAAAAASTQPQKPPQVSTQVVVMIDGESIPAISTTRTATANGVPVAPAGV